MNGSSRIAVTELSLQGREKQSESWRSRFPRAYCIEEITACSCLVQVFFLEMLPDKIQD
jgi:hypothetical protein